jgi:Trk K+ transport system NAD-binding subunit
VVCGNNPIAYRVVEALLTRYDAQVTAVVTRSEHDVWGPRIKALPGVVAVEAERLDGPTLRRVELDGVSAISLLDQDDGGNVDAALLAQELNPEMRIVMRMYNLRLGERIAGLLSNCVVLSAGEIAAPAFVAGALGESGTHVAVVDRTLIATQRDRTSPDSVLFGLANTNAGGGPPDELPADESTCDLVLAQSAAPPAPRPPRRRQSVTVVSVLYTARTWEIAGVLLVFLLLGTAALTVVNHDVARSAYITALSELAGANPDPTAGSIAQITMVVLTVVSIALIPALTAALVDSTVRARLRAERGAVPTGLSGHVVVVGLGHVGVRVAQVLHNRGVEVVAIERDPAVEGIQTVRQLGIPVVVGDASGADALGAARIASARALIVVSTDDVTNLEISMTAHAVKPDLRLVLRLFDAEFARRVQRAFGFTLSRSVSYLAAPAFAAAMLGRQVLATIPVRRHVLLVAELPVRTGSRLEHQTVAQVNRPGEARLLAIRAGDDQTLWLPSLDRRLENTETLIIVATRAGFSRLLTDTRTQVDGGSRADGQLEPAQRPRPRSDPDADSEDELSD